MKRIIIALALMSSQLALSETADKPKSISKIDGQLVKVGDKNDYEYDYKKWNIGINAFLLPQDIVSISGSYAITENIAPRVGVAFGKFGFSNQDVSANLGVPVYFKKVYSGFFVEPGVDSTAGFYVAGGYHWMWDSGFNVYLGIGAGKKGGAGMFQLAYAFDFPG